MKDFIESILLDKENLQKGDGFCNP